MAILEFENVSKSYGALTVTDDVSLRLNEGETLRIIGPNGAGKTTLFNLIGGSQPADTGKVTFNGQDVTAKSAAERCHLGIARSFQIPQPFVGMTVYENLLVVKEIYLGIDIDEQAA